MSSTEGNSVAEPLCQPETGEDNVPATAAANGAPTPREKLPTCVLLVGMAGSGKTTVMQRLNSHVRSQGKTPYIVNLDPAVGKLPYSPNIDIRDTVKYSEVMKQYQLGPNGAILTSLNLFTTKFDQVLGLLEKRQSEVDYVLIDTPGQIEVFTWSASGSIITDTLAATYPTVVLFVVDTPRTESPATFMSNMLYACSILYRTRLPFVVLFNKADVVPCEFAMDWMRDFESFQAALQHGEAGGDPPYMHSLVQSMALALDEFYSLLTLVGFSAVTGLGCAQLMDALGTARAEYEKEYKPELERLVAEREKRKGAARQQEMERLVRDLQLEGKGATSGPCPASLSAARPEGA